MEYLRIFHLLTLLLYFEIRIAKATVESAKTKGETEDSQNAVVDPIIVVDAESSDPVVVVDHVDSSLPDASADPILDDFSPMDTNNNPGVYDQPPNTLSDMGWDPYYPKWQPKKKATSKKKEVIHLKIEHVFKPPLHHASFGFQQKMPHVGFMGGGYPKEAPRKEEERGYGDEEEEEGYKPMAMIEEWKKSSGKKSMPWEEEKPKPMMYYWKPKAKPMKKSWQPMMKSMPPKKYWEEEKESWEPKKKKSWEPKSSGYEEEEPMGYGEPKMKSWKPKMMMMMKKKAKSYESQHPWHMPSWELHAPWEPEKEEDMSGYESEDWEPKKSSGWEPKKESWMPRKSSGGGGYMPKMMSKGWMPKKSSGGGGYMPKMMSKGWMPKKSSGGGGYMPKMMSKGWMPKKSSGGYMPKMSSGGGGYAPRQMPMKSRGWQPKMSSGWEQKKNDWDSGGGYGKPFDFIFLKKNTYTCACSKNCKNNFQGNRNRFRTKTSADLYVSSCLVAYLLLTCKAHHEFDTNAKAKSKLFLYSHELRQRTETRFLSHFYAFSQISCVCKTAKSI